jgi:outer membrane receptor protein involved in Fe transport
MNISLRSAASIVTVGIATCFSFSAYAQTNPQEEQNSTSEDLGTIVVTGSRIARPELESPMPISVVNMANSIDQGRLTVVDALAVVPSISPGANSYGNAQSGAGLASVNLRNMGANRTLVLIDGRRHVSGNGSSSEVNLNMIPSAMIERVEVLTGGAAAIYGADAVTGAVNIITKKKIDGLELSAHQGISEYGDASQTSISGTFGTKFASDRGRFSIGATYDKSTGVEKQHRPFTEDRLWYLANADSKGPTDGIPDILLNRDLKSYYVGSVPTFYLAQTKTNYAYLDGQLVTPSHGKEYGSKGEFGDFEGIDDRVVRNFESWEYLRNPQEAFSVIGQFEFALTDSITYNARVDYGRIKSEGYHRSYREDSRTAIFTPPLGGAIAYLDNPYTPQSVKNLLTGLGLSSVRINRMYDNWPQMRQYLDREDITGTQSLTGRLGRFTWNAFYQYGRASTDDTVTNVPLKSRWIAARNVVANSVTGAPECRDAAARAAGCTPINIFDSTGELTAAQKAWLLYDRHRSTVNKQEIFGADIAGPIFALPAGDVSVAVGVERRKDSTRTVEDPLALSGEAVPSTVIVSVTPNIKASRAVTEAYGELQVPILSDIPLIHRLEVEGAYRWSRYDDEGTTSTWKVGGTWSPVVGVTVRGVRSRSVRMPTLGELYGAITTGTQSSFNDPCVSGYYDYTPTRAANCKALGVTTPLPFYSDAAVVNGGGNPTLSPETSNSFTLGLALQPKMIRGFDLTIDYWNIDIANVITSYSFLQMMNFCVDLPSIDNVFCSNVGRDPVTKRVTTGSTQLVNAARQRAKGIDVGVNYRIPVGEGAIALSFMGSYLLQREVESVPGVATSVVKYANSYTDPHFRGVLGINYSNDDLKVSFQTRYIGKSKYDPNVSDEYYEFNDVKSKIYNDISVRYSANDKIDYLVGVNNILAVKPQMLPNIYLGANGRYDVLGRYFFVRVGVKI